MQCLIDGWHGIYIPQEFARLIMEGEFTIIDGLDDDDLRILSEGPDNPEYWDVWGCCVDGILIEDEDGRRYQLLEDVDLYIVPDDEQDDYGEELSFDEYDFDEFMQEAE